MKEQHNYESTYAAEVYSTAIDTSHPDHAKHIQIATQVAAKIEGMPAINTQHGIDRGQIPEHDYDGEAMWSAVDRTGSGSGSGPPARKIDLKANSLLLEQRDDSGTAGTTNQSKRSKKQQQQQSGSPQKQNTQQSGLYKI